MKNCNECIFHRFTWDESGKPTIEVCHGKNYSDEEAIKAIKSKECDMYEEGHKLYKEKRDFNVPASERYIIDRKAYSKEPVALCSWPDNCPDRENGYCYLRLDCTSKVNLDGSESDAHKEMMNLILNS